jgi:hypothetical protein
VAAFCSRFELFQIASESLGRGTFWGTAYSNTQQYPSPSLSDNERPLASEVMQERPGLTNEYTPFTIGTLSGPGECRLSGPPFGPYSGLGDHFNLSTLGFIMLCAHLLRLGRIRVMIYTNDHRPAHLHVWEGRRQAVFKLNCPNGPVELRENFGFSWREVSRLARLLQPHVVALCAAWRTIHGDY